MVARSSQLLASGVTHELHKGLSALFRERLDQRCLKQLVHKLFPLIDHLLALAGRFRAVAPLVGRHWGVLCRRRRGRRSDGRAQAVAVRRERALSLAQLDLSVEPLGQLEPIVPHLVPALLLAVVHDRLLARFQLFGGQPAERACMLPLKDAHEISPRAGGVGCAGCRTRTRRRARPRGCAGCRTRRRARPGGVLVPPPTASSE
ncbi:hypothetical protein T492DRAFT_964984 [Pavlovales sp. CCMP2436]|nr:hypothetical protein T492DRAFT_964984 [Pavlovales sp. CCMP2436]|mmetsp:Transcript_32987/g.82018  ORF Transcript_32987/g.82018 Transcript_32987/m.82018 type:complete len:204 (+) Transcript_32987:133-744(+)